LKARKCISEDRLIDFLEGEVSGQERADMARHLEGCPECAAREASLRRALDLAGADTVPQPDPAYWAYFAGNVRKRIGTRSASRRRRFRLVLVPGLAAAAACVLLIVLYTGRPVERAAEVDSIIADLNASEVADEVMADAALDELIIGEIGRDAGLVDEYLVETGDIDEMVGELTEDEQRDLINRLSSLMELRGSVDGSMRKGC
jgi:hypothetical protein